MGKKKVEDRDKRDVGLSFREARLKGVLQERVEVEERRTLVSGYLREHKADTEIARLLGMPVRVIRSDIDALLAQWQETQLRNADTYFTTDIEGLDIAQKAIFGKVREGNLSAISTYLDIIKRRADMLGYDKNRAKGTAKDPLVVQELSNAAIKSMSTEELEKIEGVLLGFNKVEEAV